MNESPCDREHEVLDAAASGHVPEDLLDHAASCEQCSESLLVGSFLSQAAAQLSVGLPPLPDPGYVWWRARLERRAAASERATRIITLVQRAAVLSAGLVAIPLVRWAWPHIRSIVGAVNPAALAPSLPADAGRPDLVIAVSLAAVAALTLLEIYGNWLEQ